jgi:hypothetical protein
MPYCQINAMLDAAYPKGALNYWKSNFLASLSDEALRTMIDCFAKCPTTMGQLLLEHFHGAVTRVNVTATAFPHRAPGYNLIVLSEWMDPKDNDACINWARDSYTAMQPFMGSGRYVNYLGDDESGDPRRRRLWTEPSTPPTTQGEIRSAELFPREPEHPSAGVSVYPLVTVGHPA